MSLCAGYTFSVQKLRAIFGGFSPIAVTALLSVIILGSVAIARTVAVLFPPAVQIASAEASAATSTPAVSPDALQELLLLGLATSTDAAAAAGTDHLSMIGPMVVGQILGTYNALRESGAYTTDDLRDAATEIAESMKAAVSYEPFENDDFKTSSDVSAERARSYRDDLQRTLAPLSAIPGAEYEIYGRYVETHDQTYLLQLKDAAHTYRTVANSAAALTIPRDAITEHRDLLNALRAFSSVLDGLTDHADDPYASVALLRTYTEKEQVLYEAFNHMRSYYAKKEL